MCCVGALCKALCLGAAGIMTEINTTVTALKEFIKCKRQTHNWSTRQSCHQWTDTWETGDKAKASVGNYGKGGGGIFVLDPQG